MKAELQKQGVNEKLFEFIMKAILEEPKRMNMGIWLKIHLTEKWVRAEKERQLSEQEQLYGDIGTLVKQLEEGGGLPACGTVGCLAGWACVINPRTGKMVRRPKYGWGKAQKKLGLTEEQAESLFYPDQWPIQFEDRLAKHKLGTLKYAKVVVARIKFFLRTGK